MVMDFAQEHPHKQFISYTSAQKYLPVYENSKYKSNFYFVILI